MNSTTIQAVAAAGFDVYMRDQTDSWLIFTDGKSLGYLQENYYAGVSISTVHKPSKAHGKGYHMFDCGIHEINHNNLAMAFATCPEWAARSASEIHKWGGIDKYRAADNFNAAYQLVAKGK